MRRALVAAFLLFTCSALVHAQANGATGRLQIHFLDVGQGDAAVLVSPNGEVAMFDAGGYGPCDGHVWYLEQLGIRQMSDLIVSHYHDDHTRCVPDMLTQFGSNATVYDRGDSGSGQESQEYLTAVATKRRAVSPGTTRLVLDGGTANPVSIDVVAANGDGVTGASDENDLSVVAVVRYGAFVAAFGGDLSGANRNNYRDVESSVAPRVGPIDVLKVHHHCSKYSSNNTWLSTTQPRVAVISVGSGYPNTTYHHPTSACLDRLHAHGVATYWTEGGEGAEPVAGQDVVANGPIVVNVENGGHSFSVTAAGESRTYSSHAATPTTTAAPAGAGVTYVWSRRSDHYHVSECPYTTRIRAENRQEGTTPPHGKTAHACCPQ